MNVFMQNEKLWLDILTSFINTYRGPYESDLLATLTPLLVATLDHSRRSIKRQAVQFWAATFGKSLQLEYPDALKPILERIRRKVTIVLPGLATSSTVVGGTPAAAVQMAQVCIIHLNIFVLNLCIRTSRARSFIFSRCSILVRTRVVQQVLRLL